MDHLKTKAQLIAELEVLRAQVATLTQVTEQSPSKPSLLVNYLSSRENGKSLQVLCVEDCEVYRNIYQRFLRQNQEYNYEIINFNLGEEALSWCQQNQPDILLLDYSLPDMDGLEFLIQFRTYWENHQCPALVITGQGNTEIAVEFFKQGAQDYLDKSQITADSLNRSVTHLVQKTQLLQEQQWQQQRQQLIAKTALSIRQSLNLDEILQTTVTEIRQILQSDRVIVYQFQPDRTGIILQESVCDPTLSLLGQVMPEEHFPYTWVTPYEQGRTRVIQDIYTDPDISDCHREFLEQLHVRSNLIVPLLLRDHLWGLLIAHHCTAPRFWTANEVNLMQELATQVSIAIQQATLLEELQQELLDRKQAEIALQHSQEHLKTAVESADLGTWCLDVAAQVSTVSDRFKAIFGFPPTPGTVTFNSIIQHIHPDDCHRVREAIGQTIAHQQPYNAEYRIIWPDGTVRWVLAKGKPLSDQEGHVVMVAGCVLDLTEHKHLETQAQISEERLNLALDLTGIGCWDWNLQTQDVVWNENHFRLLGLDPETAVSDYATWQKSVHPDDIEDVEAGLQQSIQTQELYSVEYRIIKPDGSLHWIWGAGNILRDQPTRMLGVIKDITPRKQAEIALHNLNTELEEKVKQRTKILTQINNRLQEELIAREIMENELKNTEQLLQSFFDAASVANIGLGIRDHQFRFVQVNQAFADMNGYSIEAHLNHSVTEILPHLAPSIQPLLQQVLETGEAVSNLEMAIALPQEPNVMRYWLVSYFPIPGNSKNQNAIGNIIIEISDRKRIEIEREKLIDILEVTSDIIATAAVNTLEVEYLNLSGCRVFGFSEHTPIDQLSIPDVHPPWAFSILKNQGIPTAIREGVWMGETAILKSDGAEIPVSQVILAHTFGTNQVQFISTIIRNITQQKQTEATLRESNRRWQSLLDNVQLIVVALNQDSQVEYVNPFFLKLTGYSEVEVLGKMWFDHFVPLDQKLEVNKTFQEIMATDFHPYYQNSILTQSGEERIIAWNNTLLQNVEGQPIGTLSIGEDITERYQLERMKAEFISMVSHELRTPLTAMQAGLSLLHSNIIAPQSPEGQITLDIVMTGVNRLVRLVNDILDLERLESGKIRLAIRPCDVTILINTAIAQMQELANQGGIVLESQIQPFEIDADPDRLLQVLINLLSNAIKFSPNHSVIHLSVHLYQSSSDDEQPTINTHQASTSNKIYPPLTSDFLLFAIRDQGRGIPKENLESIFERFHQVDSSDSREKGGTGLGLAICRSIIQQHGGQIWVESRLQVGSTFYFTIPINYEASSYY
ncbi:PAS domain S-box protein [Planktothrix mougeotii]|uniref:histidine kinase n=1 Tax=Planktothrix mougeotii LEGE 06226 TaxID=1828728 RepID=A0ABR9U8J1_9CYAN|nr:PAS domain S-box protein [Planktothrix mougeotii]MBE9142760.1 PAS domain S-box protein [Planktothrix mougeotii LEGE 06226]